VKVDHPSRCVGNALFKINGFIKVRRDECRRRLTTFLMFHFAAEVGSLETISRADGKYTCIAIFY
jgi:hypothetical protein